MKNLTHGMNTEISIHKKFSFSAHAPLTIIHIDSGGFIKQINTPFLDNKVSDMLGKQFTSFVEASYQTSIDQTINKVIQEGLQLSCEITYGKEDAIQYFVIHFEPEFEDYTCMGLMLIVREITGSKKAIDALKASEERELKSKASLKTVFDHTRIGYVLLDNQLNLISFNEPARIMTMALFKKEVRLDSKLQDYFPAELVENLSLTWNKALGGEYIEYEREHKHDDGNYHWYEIQYLPVKDENGSVIHLIMKIHDITKRKLKEQQLLSIQEERFQFAIEGSNDGIWDWNVTTNEVYYSERWKKMLGFEAQEIKNDFSEWEIRLHPDDKERVLTEVNNTLKEKNYSYAVEHRLKCKNGEYKWILARAKVIEWEGGKPVRMAGTHTDISMRKEMEARIAHNEKMLSGILDTLPVIVFAKDITNEFRFSIWNKQAEEVFGLKNEECIGKNDYDFFSKEDADFFRKKDIEAIGNKGILDIPEETVQTPGGPILIHTLKTVVRDKDGKPLYLLGVSENISELKKINDTLKVSEERYRSLVENSPIIIMTTNKEEIIQFTNFSGGNRPVSEIIGNSVYQFLAPEYHALVREAHKKVFSTKKIATYETEGFDINGARIWFQTHVGPMFSGNEVTGLTLFTRNISERIENEEKIKRSLKEKEVLLQEVHHRVKNNLQIISSILNLQTRSISDKKVLELIKETRYRIMSMSFIHDLLYQTKDFTNIDFSRYLENITSNIMNTYTLNKNITLNLAIESILLNLDSAIPCGLIVNELITNAFKYAFPAGKEGEISIELKRNNNRVTLSVADNGVGIDKQVDYKTTESLGFQLINSLVTQIEGELHYENNNGTKFTVSFLI